MSDSDPPTKVDRPARPPSDAPPSAAPPSADPRKRRTSDRVQEPPSWLGDARYEPRFVLGRGGMGEVILANDSHIGRQIAVKVMKAPRGDGPIARSRFLGEARLQAQLEHPAVVPVYDIGYDAEGSPFFTMKHVHGVTLDEAIRRIAEGDADARRDYPLHKLLAAFQQVCLVVHLAHSRGVIHRDLKPSNVMLGEFGEVYVLDWGVAKRGESPSGGPPPLTAPGQGSSPSHSSPVTPTTPPTTNDEVTDQGVILGTAGYMAPEQRHGRADGVDGRADVYSLGVMLRKIVNALPTGSDRTSVLGDWQANSQRETDAPAPELLAACERATAPDPANRFQTARDLYDAVDAFLSGNRDLELRRSLAAEHVARARDFESGLHTEGGGGAARMQALREVGRAIALDPTRGEALELLVRLLTEPPKFPPREVLLELEAAGRISRERSYPKAAAAYLTLGLVALPLAPIVGVRDFTLFVIPLVAWLLSSLLAVVARKYDDVHRKIPFLPVASAAAVATMSLYDGPFLMVPLMGAVNAICFVLAARPEVRRTAVVAGCIGMTLPMLLAWLGVHPVPVTFEGDALRMTAGALHLPANGTYLFLATSYIVIVLIAARFVGTYRDALTAAETRNLLQAWQLRQLVPPEAQRAIVPSAHPPRVSSTP